ncbi:energy-coupling factor transporter transmembrane protein EcfT [Halorubrum sp. CBA1125]|uniref:energy-coupling factor transporter transmembrane component T family protein n=1 Tax=Halorubrum sp. CBA1125 TaxID=2668072 RepID=UPI0012E84E1C|nr:energy-coupling factor transporter transmembrane component T [Halorubrum sp. CBA1125]MUW13445.1 energy-coupling factor transporter transmembrane protein EcfT [Halorubrum sp. CBA1125]
MSARDIDINKFIKESTEGESGILQYKPGDTLVHNLNPVTKIVVATGLIIGVWMYPNFVAPAVIFGILLGIVFASRLYRNILPVLVVVGAPLLFMMFTIHGLFYPGNMTPYYTISPVPVIESITIYEEGLLFAAMFFFRIMVLLTALLLAIVSTHPREFGVAFTEKGMPPKLAYVFLAALQLVPDMRRQANSIMEAQQSRGLDIHANVWQRLKAFFALMTPLIIGTLISAETRALALESRGFGRTKTPTSLFETTETTVDYMLQACTVVGVIAAVGWRVFLA